MKQVHVSCTASERANLINATTAVNIHSHLAGALLFCWILVTFQQQYLSNYVSITWLDTTVFVIFLVSAVLCLSFSATYHTSCAHSKEVRSSIDLASCAVDSRSPTRSHHV